MLPHKGLETTQSIADIVARLAKDIYDSIPNVGKPVTRSNGIPEWTILAGVVVQAQGKQPSYNRINLDRHFISLLELGDGS